jgi:PAS domain S-box-containing protein
MNSSPLSTAGPSKHNSRIHWGFIAVFFLLSATIACLGWLFYVQREKAIKAEKQSELAAIADLKAEEIINWREERLTDARVLVSNPPVTSLFLEKYLRSSKDRTLQKALSAWLTHFIELEHYRSAFLLDNNGKQLFAIPDGRILCGEPGFKHLLDSAIGNRCIVMTDLHKDGTEAGDVHSDMIVPIVPASEGENGPALGALALDIDPKQFLYPLIQSWPTPSRTAEVLLVRKDGNNVVYLNNLRHQKNTALSLRLPLSDTDLPAARAVSGYTGPMEGNDYRDVPVLAVGRHIPGTQWYMIAKLDKSEALAASQTLFFRAVFVVMMLIVLAGVVIALLQRHRSSLVYKRLYLAEKEKAGLTNSLSESEEKFRRIFEQSPLGKALSDKNSRFISANPAFCAMLGYTEEELKKLTFKDITHSEHLKADAAAVEQLIRGEIPVYKTEKRYVTKSGTTLYGALTLSSLRDTKGEHQFSMIILENITEKKKAADALAAEKERLAVTLRSIGDAVIATDVKGRVVLMNKVAEQLTGYTFAESEGRPLADIFNIINENTRKKCESPVDKVLSSGIVVGLANHTALISKDGAEHAIADSGAPIRDKDSVIIGVVLVFRDISGKLKSEEALRNAQKLESLGVLAGGIAHDFNNLLSGMFGYLDLARESVEKNSTAAEYLEKAFSVFGRAKDLTGQLLTFSKGGAPAKKTRPLAPLIRDAVHFAMSGSTKKVSFEIPADLWPCDVDENQLGQVLDNIVINARDAMPMAGEITVSAANIPLGSKLPETLLPGTYVRILIRDQGIGIAPEHLPRIFDPFFTTKQKGSGLGLATSYSIIKRHGGAIEVESLLGKGTTFFIYLPASDNSVGEIAAEAKPSDRGAAGRVLVMDDEAFILDTAGAMLRNLGYSVDTAANGAEAIDKFNKARSEGAPFCLVVLDLTIPGGIGGKEAGQKLLAIDPTVRILASSGYSEDPVISHPEKFGFRASLVKPYRTSELAEAVARAMG